MEVRFFNAVRPDGRVAPQIALTPPAEPGEARQAVRWATEADKQLYPQAWAAYVAAETARQAEQAPQAAAPAPKGEAPKDEDPEDDADGENKT
jgi:hypothetical protein